MLREVSITQRHGVQLIRKDKLVVRKSWWLKLLSFKLNFRNLEASILIPFKLGNAMKGKDLKAVFNLTFLLIFFSAKIKNYWLLKLVNSYLNLKGFFSEVIVISSHRFLKTNYLKYLKINYSGETVGFSHFDHMHELLESFRCTGCNT